MLNEIAILLVCAAATVAAVRVLVIRGIESVGEALHFSSKTRGQIIGYATSVPEFVVLIAAALAGVFEAGFWNIASSNIINLGLFISAIVVYRQHLKLFSLRFLDEVIFAAASIAIPLALYAAHITLSVPVGIELLIMFAIYKVADKLLNAKHAPPAPALHVRPSIALGLLYIVAGLVVIVVAGRYLGDSASVLVKEVGTPPWLVGWILGLITSIPEMASFFEIFRLSKHRGQQHLKDDMQQALDALVASNMCNLGVILAIGILVYAAVS